MITKDLNLLKILSILLEERHISRAAERLHVTQPAVSRALSRLREEFDDPLFVRTPKGMLPTTKALSLEKPLMDLLATVETFYSEPKGFNPATAKGVVRIATTDYFEQVIWTELVGKLNGLAPDLQFVTLLTGSELPKNAMQDGTIHLAIAGFFRDLPAGFMRQTLFSDHFVSVVRKDHPVVKKTLTLDDFLRLSHLVISPKGDASGAVDVALSEKGKSRRVAVSVSSFLSSGPVVAGSDLILTAPSKLVEKFTSQLTLKSLPTPITLPKIKIIQVWHERFNQDPMITWVRKIISQSCTGNE